MHEQFEAIHPFLDGNGRVGRLMMLELHRRYTELLNESGRIGTRPLVDHLFRNPYSIVAAAAEAMRVSNPTARAAINFLQEKGMLKEITGRDWGRRYVAPEILKAIGSENDGNGH